MTFRRLKRLVVVLAWITFAVVILNTIIPFTPVFPASGLDSWGFGLSYAISHHLQFGKQIIFTLGPYASLYTKVYTPSTATLTFSASAFLAICYLLGFAYIWRQSKPRNPCAPLLILSVALIVLQPMNDSVFMIYPAVCVLAAALASDPRQPTLSRPNEVITTLLMVVLFTSLGLICLIKSSFAVVSIIASAISCVLFLYKNKLHYALVAVVVPSLAVVAFWFISGQRLPELPAFAKASIPIIMGYTSAMSISGRADDFIFIFVNAASMAVLLYLLKMVKCNKVILLSLYLLVTFLLFKEGFVRHDAHARIAADGLLLLTLILTFVSTVRTWLIPVIVVASCTVAIDGYYSPMSPFVLKARVAAAFVPMFDTTAAAVTKQATFLNQYRSAMASIRAASPLPALKGGSDIYPVDVSTLIASGNEWDPRPVFQSYAAYTPALAMLNAGHLEGSEAPENIFLSIATIDTRFPSLEDGASWPALLTSYTPQAMDGGFAVLKRMASATDQGVLVPAGTRAAALGVEVPLSVVSDSPIFAELDVKQSFFGQLLSILFKPPELQISVWTRDGNKQSFRLVPGSARSPFLLSPLVTNTDQFLLLYTAPSLSSRRAVRAVEIAVVGGPSRAWARAYTLRLFRLARHGATLAATDPVISNALARTSVHRFRLYDGAAIDKPGDAIRCSLDAVDGKPAAGANVIASGTSATFGGWVGNGHGKALRKGLFILNGPQRAYATTLMTGVERPDVAKALDSSAMASSGFNLITTLAGVPAGTYSLLIATPVTPTMTCDLRHTLTVH